MVGCAAETAIIGQAAMPRRPKIPDNWIGRFEAARMLGLSRGCFQARIEDLAETGGAILGKARDGKGNKWFFDPEVLKAQVDKSEIKPVRLFVENHEGNRDSRVFAALEGGASVASIVIAEKVAAQTVLTLRERWIAAHEADRKGLAFACGCGLPSNPSTARCDRCAARARVLSDSELAVLSGAQSHERDTCSCSGCGAAVDTAAADHICRKCVAALTVVARGDKGFIVLGGRVLRELSAIEIQTLRLALHAQPHPQGTSPTANEKSEKSEGLRLIEQARAEAEADAAVEQTKLETAVRKVADNDEDVVQAFKINPGTL